MIRYLSHQAIDFERWDHCVQTGDLVLIYAYSWYLNIVTRQQWGGLVMGDYEAVMPLPWNVKFMRLKQLYQPLVTQQLGVFGCSVTTQQYEAFLTHIPQQFRYLKINLNENCPAPLATDLGLRPVQNFVLNLRNPYEQIQADYGKSLRKRIRKSREVLHLVSGGTVTDLVAYYRQAMQDRIYLPAQDWVLIEQLFTEVTDRGMGQIYRVFNQEQELVAYGIFYDVHQRIYNVFAASNEKGKQQYAMHFLLDEVIRQHVGKRECLDFEGSEIPGVATFFASYGSKVKPYYRLEVNRLPGWANALLSLKGRWKP